MDLSLNSFLNVPSVVKRHYSEGRVNWPMVLYISLIHIVGLVSLTYVPKASYATLAWSLLLWPVSGFGITVGAHRLWSHR